MKLHENKTLFRQAVQFTSQQMGIPEIFIEKDYWVTFALKIIFQSEAQEYAVFKGGTSIMKCFQIINRFSEDIDLVVLRKEGESNNRMNAKLKRIGEIVGKALPETNLSGLTVKMGMNRKTAHAYNQEFQGNYGQVRDKIVLEVTWLGFPEPYVTVSVSSLIHDIIVKSNQQSILEEYELLPFPLKVLDPKRTFCEKIMSLVRFSYSENPIEDLQNKVRHIYDLHHLLQVDEISDFFKTDQFDQMLQRVGQDDVISYKNNNRWLALHPRESLLFKEPITVWDKLKEAYVSDFGKLVFDNRLPPVEEIRSTLLNIKNRLDNINWTITV